jgi:mono/diheme cytochrome c family protein
MIRGIACSLALLAACGAAAESPVPPFAATLTFAQIRDVSAYVATRLGK